MNKDYFLKKDLDFKKVYKKRKTFGNRNFTLYVRRNGLDHCRMGFSINKKVGKAVIRNRIKRRLRALYEKYNDRINPGWDYVLVVKTNVADMNFAQIESAFYHIFKISRSFKGKEKK